MKDSVNGFHTNQLCTGRYLATQLDDDLVTVVCFQTITHINDIRSTLVFVVGLKFQLRQVSALRRP